MSMEPAEEYTPLGVEKTEEKTEEEDKLTVEQMVDKLVCSNIQNNCSYNNMRALNRTK